MGSLIDLARGGALRRAVAVLKANLDDARATVTRAASQGAALDGFGEGWMVGVKLGEQLRRRMFGRLGAVLRWRPVGLSGAELDALRALLADKRKALRALEVRAQSQDAALKRLQGFVALVNTLLERPGMTDRELAEKVRAEVAAWVDAAKRLDAAKRSLKVVPPPQSSDGADEKPVLPPSGPGSSRSRRR